MSKPPLFFIAVIVLIGVLATQRYFNQRKQDAQNDRLPLRHIMVVVSEKREFPAQINRSRQREHIANENMRYEVTFVARNDLETIKVLIKPQQYNVIAQGAQGTLTMQGTRFISFVPNVQ